MDQAEINERYSISKAAANGRLTPRAAAQVLLLVSAAGDPKLSDEDRGRETAEAYARLKQMIKDDDRRAACQP